MTNEKKCSKDCLSGGAWPGDEVLAELADLFKNFADSSRIRIIRVLFDKERCVNAISEELCMGQSAVSHQLRVLKQNKLVKCRRAGKTVYYALADEHVKVIFNQGLAHILE